MGLAGFWDLHSDTKAYPITISHCWWHLGCIAVAQIQVTASVPTSYKNPSTWDHFENIPISNHFLLVLDFQFNYPISTHHSFSYSGKRGRRKLTLMKAYSVPCVGRWLPIVLHPHYAFRGHHASRASRARGHWVISTELCLEGHTLPGVSQLIRSRAVFYIDPSALSLPLGHCYQAASVAKL